MNTAFYHHVVVGLSTIVVQITCKSVWEEKVKVTAGEILKVTAKHHDAGAQKAPLLHFTFSNLLKLIS